MLPVLRNTPAFAPIVAGPIDRLNTLFDRVLGEGELLGQAWAGVPVAMWEDADHIYVEAELPGIVDKDVDVTVEAGVKVSGLPAQEIVVELQRPGKPPLEERIHHDGTDGYHTVHFQVRLDQAGRYTLRVTPRQKRAAAVMDLRSVTLQPTAE